MPRNRLPSVMKRYSPTGRRNHGRTLKRLLDTWDRNGSTSGPAPWQRWWWWWWWVTYGFQIIDFHELDHSSALRRCRLRTGLPRFKQWKRRLSSLTSKSTGCKNKRHGTSCNIRQTLITALQRCIIIVYIQRPFIIQITAYSNMNRTSSVPVSLQTTETFLGYLHISCLLAPFLPLIRHPSFSERVHSYSWFQTFAVFCMLYVSFWAIPRHLNFKFRRFGTLCLFHLHRQVGL
jgi:hypothetical protein